MSFTNRFNFYIKEMKAELRENGLDDKFDVNIFKNKIYTNKNNIRYITMNEDKVKFAIEVNLSMKDINTLIKQEICYKTLEELN